MYPEPFHPDEDSLDKRISLDARKEYWLAL
jgi:hypothetical protein